MLLGNIQEHQSRKTVGSEGICVLASLSVHLSVCLHPSVEREEGMSHRPKERQTAVVYHVQQETKWMLLLFYVIQQLLSQTYYQLYHFL